MFSMPTMSDQPLWDTACYHTHSVSAVTIATNLNLHYCKILFGFSFKPEISLRLRNKFPSMNSLVKSGLLRSSEVKQAEGCSWWCPILWSLDLLSAEERSGFYRYGKHHLLERLTEWREKLSNVTTYSMAPVPLVYTQVGITILFKIKKQTRSGGPPGGLCLFWSFAYRWSVDHLEEAWGRGSWCCLSVLHCLQISLYIWLGVIFSPELISKSELGWLRVAETLYDPWGEDDGDFDVAELLHRHKRWLTITVKIIRIVWTG